MVSSVLGLKRRTPRDFPSRSSARRSRSGASSTGSTARSFGRAPASPGSARGLEVAVFLILSKTIDVLLSPLVWSMILLAVGAWLSESRGSSARPGAESGRRKTARRICFGASLGLLYVLSTRSADRILMTAIESSAVDGKRDGVAYEAVIVLGGFVREHHRGRSSVAIGSCRPKAAWGADHSWSRAWPARRAQARQERAGNEKLPPPGWARTCPRPRVAG